MLPNAGNVEFLIRRCLVNLPPRMRGRGIGSRSKWGAQIVDTNVGNDGNDDKSDKNEKSSPAFIAWVIEPNEAPDRILITRLRCPSPQLLPILLSAAAEAANEYGMTHVEVWNLPRDLCDIAFGLGGVESEQDVHLAAMKWYGDDCHDEDQVEWVMNEKYVVLSLCSPFPALSVFSHFLERSSGCDCYINNPSIDPSKFSTATQGRDFLIIASSPFLTVKSH